MTRDSFLSDSPSLLKNVRLDKLKNFENINCNINTEFQKEHDNNRYNSGHDSNSFEEGEEREEVDIFNEEDEFFNQPSYFRRTQSFGRCDSFHLTKSEAHDTLELVLDPKKCGKNKEQLDFVLSSKYGLEDGYSPQPVDAYSESGCYYIRSINGLHAVFKPVDEESKIVMRHGINAGEGYLREVAAYLLDHKDFAGVPPTVLTRVYSSIWETSSVQVPGEYHKTSMSFTQRSLDTSSPISNFTNCSNILDSTDTSSHSTCSTSSKSNNSSFSSTETLNNFIDEEAKKDTDGQQFSCSDRGSRRLSRAMSIAVESSYCHDDNNKASLNSTQIRSAPSSPSKLPLASESKVGSLQAYVRHHSTADDIGCGLFPLDAVQRIGVLDIRIMNLDRHPGNLLLQTVNNSNGENKSSPARRLGKRAESFCEFSMSRSFQEDSSSIHKSSRNSLKLIPIDHGCALPSITNLPNGSGETNEDCIELDWMSWPQAKQPFLPSVIQYVENIDIEADVELLNTALNGAFGPDVLLTLRVCTILLKHMVKKGKTLYEIGSVLRSGYFSKLIVKAGANSLKGHCQDEILVNSFMERITELIFQDENL